MQALIILHLRLLFLLLFHFSRHLSPLILTLLWQQTSLNPPVSSFTTLKFRACLRPFWNSAQMPLSFRNLQVQSEHNHEICT